MNCASIRYRWLLLGRLGDPLDCSHPVVEH